MRVPPPAPPAPTDEQLALRDTARALLSRECPPARVRAAWDEPAEAAAAPPAWVALARAGVVGMTAPERFGGGGLDAPDWALVMEEAGRAALPGPLLETTAVAIPLLAALGGDALCDRWLGGAAAGRAVLAVGLGGAPYVADAARAHLLVLEHAGEVHAVERAAVTLTAQPSVDGARRLARVAWQPSAATCLADGPRAAAQLAAAFDRGALAAAAQLVGVARHLIEATVDYAKVRTQFGRAIGSFQAVKHHLARAHVAIELAWPCVWRAAHAVAGAGADRAIAVSLAKARASAAALGAARAALQCHGAIGYSFEHDLHLWMKRAWTLAAAWGDAAWHTERVAALILDPTSQGPAHA
jgi:alkylation response protein AidB-like acyl-CoA dehydrogenase